MNRKETSARSLGRVVAGGIRLCCGLLFVVLALFAADVYSQNDDPVIVQPGAPGQPSKKLPNTTRAKLPPSSPKDVEFMQGMITHHEQAVQMVALMPGRVESKKVKLLGDRISQSQSDEIGFMKRWLRLRGKKVPMSIIGMSKSMEGHKMAGHKMDGHDMMPGMLTPKQMKELAEAKGDEFDRLFLEGMIQHHIGALIMVKDLFDTPGAGQDGELFTFTSEVDSGQRAEIRLMQSMLEEFPAKEKSN